MKKNNSRKITLEEFKDLLQKMNFYNLNEGYIGDNNGKLLMFIAPCEKAQALITKSQVIDAIASLELLKQK
jgi:hypothetical protein